MEQSKRQKSRVKRGISLSRRTRRAKQRLEVKETLYQKAMRETTGHPRRYTKPGSLQLKS